MHNGLSTSVDSQPVIENTVLHPSLVEPADAEQTDAEG